MLRYKSLLFIRVLWMAAKAVAIFLLLLSGANPTVIYQRF